MESFIIQSSQYLANFTRIAWSIKQLHQLKKCRVALHTNLFCSTRNANPLYTHYLNSNVMSLYLLLCLNFNPAQCSFFAFAPATPQQSALIRYSVQSINVNTPFTQIQIHIHSRYSRPPKTELSAKYQQLFRLVSHYAPKPRLPRPSARPLSALDWHRLVDFRLANSPRNWKKKASKGAAKLAAAACQLFTRTQTHTDTLSHTYTYTPSHTQATCLNDFSFATQQSRAQKIIAWRFSCECRVKWMRNAIEKC